MFVDTISSHAAKNNTTHNTTNFFFFVTLAPKPDFHLHRDQPQHETHNPQHILSEWICCCLGIPFLDRCLRMFFLYSTQGSDKICQDLQRSAKIKQDQPKDRQAQTCKRHLQKQIMKRRAPKMRGRRCHAAWRLQSAPGPWAPEACLTRKLHSLIYYISIILAFFLGYILSGGFFDVKLGVRCVTPDSAQTPFFASIFAIDFWRSFFRILAPFLVHF